MSRALDTESGRKATIAFIEQNEGNIGRIYTDSVGVPTMGIGYALAIRDSKGSYLIRPRFEEDFKEAKLLEANQCLTVADYELLHLSIDALNRVPGKTSPITAWKPTETPAKTKVIHKEQGWSFAPPTLEVGRLLIDKTLDDYEHNVVRSLAKKGGTDIRTARARFDALSQHTQIALIDLGYNAPGLIGPGLSLALNCVSPDKLEAWRQIFLRSNSSCNFGLYNRRMAEAGYLDLTGLTKQQISDFMLKNCSEIDAYLQKMKNESTNWKIPDLDNLQASLFMQAGISN